jgi:hypothetical protein
MFRMSHASIVRSTTVVYSHRFFFYLWKTSFSIKWCGGLFCVDFVCTRFQNLVWYLCVGVCLRVCLGIAWFWCVDTRPWQKRCLQNDVQNLQQVIHRTNKSKPHNQMPRIHQIRKIQPTTICLCTTHPKYHTWIQQTDRNNHTTKTCKTQHSADPIRTIIHPGLPPNWQPCPRTKQQWNKHVISTNYRPHATTTLKLCTYLAKPSLTSLKMTVLK